MADLATREEWLTQAGRIIMAEIVGPHGAPASGPPPWTVTCSFPTKRALSASNRNLGECWDSRAASDGAHYIFITPLEHEPVGGDGKGVLPTLTHELVHVVTWGCGHKGRFKQVAKACGLEGKMTATHAGKELCEKLAEIAKRLGPYPQAQLTAAFTGRKVESTRMLKVMCPKCGYTARVTRLWLDVGSLSCPDGDQLVEV